MSCLIKLTTIIGAALVATMSRASAVTVSIDPGTLVSGYISLAEWNSNGNFESWTFSQISGQTVSGGTLSGSVLDANNDPQFLRQNFSSLGINLDSGNYDVVEVRIRLTGTDSRFDMFWGTTSPAPAGLMTARTTWSRTATSTSSNSTCPVKWIGRRPLTTSVSIPFPQQQPAAAASRWTT